MKFLLLTLCTLALFGSPKEPITLEWLEKQPKSFAKDFYIWRYLDQNITVKESHEVMSQVRYLNNKILYRFIDKAKDINLQEYKKCMRSSTKNLLHKEAFCIEAGLSLYDATSLSAKDLEKTIQKLEKEYPTFVKKLKVLQAKIPFEQLVLGDKNTFFDTFNQCGGKYRVANFNHPFPPSLFEKLKADKKFGQTIKLIVTNLDMIQAQKSLLQLDPDGLDFRAVFHLAINAIRHHEEKRALVYLEDAFSKAYFKMQKDNITFWQYQLTKDQKYLEKLANSWDVNLYSLFAQDLLNQTHKNIVYTLPQKENKNTSYDITDPFAWLEVLDDSKKMDEKKRAYFKSIFTTKEMLGHLAFVEERFSNYRQSYFVTPYENYLQGISVHRKALIYAIGRQESRFIPTSISSAYAMGTMQIMPFLSKAIAKELKEPYDIDAQLDAKTNLRFANHHLTYLERNVDNPLFIAYAYNGGIGFTRRLLKTELFKKGKYEPFLSMELLPYDETKKYGKKVLANYFVYDNYFNPKNPMRLQTLIKKIQNF